MKKITILTVLVAFYLALIIPLADSMNSRPVAEKLGFVPGPEPLKIISADNKVTVAALLVLKTLQYFGAVSDPSTHSVSDVDFPDMYSVLTTALKLDPYNMDAYYFCQAFLVWDVGEIHAANSVLDYGMKYRTWDFYLPFFAGFNNAYFLKDYVKAAHYYRMVADLTGSELSIALTGRYLKESGRTEQAISYLRTMERVTRNEAVKRSFGRRLKAFEGVLMIERARDKFRDDKGQLPVSLKEIIQAGYLENIPVEPYGGSFFLGKEGQVRSTSNFGTGWHTRKGKSKPGDQHP